MWAIENKTQYPAERIWLRDRKGAEVLVIIVKATYNINRNGSAELSSEQKPICISRQYMGEPGKSSLLYDTDLNLTKTATDVYLHGHAYAPNGKPVTDMEVGFRVGTVEKYLHVTGDRCWFKVGPVYSLSKPSPFIIMPIVYERSFGGQDKSDDPKKQGYEKRNPVGAGFAVEKKNLNNTRAPNFTYRGIKYPDDAAKVPAGFGPIAPEWMPRLQMAGTYDAEWKQMRSPLLPLDFDESYFQCSPEDQQAPEFLQGSEQAILVNLTPEGVLKFSLPKLCLAFETVFSDKKVDHKAKLHTVIIEPDQHQLQMVWHTSVTCHKDLYKLKKTVISEKELH